MKRSIFLLAILAVLFPCPTASAAVTVKGIVIDKAANRAIAGASVGVQETREIVVADEYGRFTLSLEPGTKYTVIVQVPGYRRTVITLEKADPAGLLKVFMTEELVSGDEILVTARKEKQNVGRQTIRRDEVKKVPGTAGDMMRAVQGLPGVATSNDVSGQLYVRGNGPYDNRFLVDKFWLVNAYHYGGFVSVINSDLIESIDFYSAAFPVMYGEATGAILEINTRQKEEPTWGGKVNVNLLTADFVLETPFTENGYMILSGRRSYFDLYAQKLVEKMQDVDVTTMPLFWDYQGKIGYFISKKNIIEVIWYGSQDKVGMVIKSDDDLDLKGRKFYDDAYFHGGGVTWKYIPSKNFISTFKTGVMYQKTRLFFGEYLDVDNTVIGSITREDLSLTFSKLLDLDLGAEYIYGRVNLDAVVPVPNRIEPPPLIFPDDFNFINLRLNNLNYHHFGSYVQNTMDLSPLKWVLGARYDLQQDVERFHYVSPRTALELSLDKSNRISAATGYYQKAQDIYYTNKTFGNPDMTTQKAWHYLVGYHHDFDRHTTFSLEAYYKRLWDLPVTTAAGSFDDKGTGRVYGGEFLFRRNLAEKFFGWASYGYSVSRRDDHDGGGCYFFDYDRTHTINLIASYKPYDWLQVGLKWKYSSGLPYTKIIGDIGPGGDGQYNPVYSDNYNGSRFPAYQKLDIRFDFFKNWWGLKWDLYIEILNVYNSKNINSEEFSQKEPYSSSNPKKAGDLPFLPYFGVEVRF